MSKKIDLEQKLDDLNFRVKEIELFLEKFIRDEINNKLNRKSLKEPNLRLIEQEEMAEA